MIGIIAAMQLELNGIKDLMTDPQEEVISGISFIQGYIHGRQTVAAVCGIGKVFAGMCAQTMILRYAPTAIINVGVAGALSKQLHVCDIAVADRVVQYDIDTSALGDPVGLISGINMVYLPCDKLLVDTICSAVSALSFPMLCGTIATGDRFVSDNTQKQTLADTFQAIACEMEGGGIGQVCYVNQVKFAIIRAISDGFFDAGMDYEQFKVQAAKHSCAVLEAVLKQLPPLQ